MRIVVCDDHLLLLEALGLALGARGHEVVALAGTPEEAVSAVAMHRPDVCLLDVNFPAGPRSPRSTRSARSHRTPRS